MKSVLIISVFALTTAVSSRSNWPFDGLDRTNDFRNPFLTVNRPIRQGEPLPRDAAGHSTNNINNYGALPYLNINGVNNQLKRLPNVQVNNIQLVPILHQNNAYQLSEPNSQPKFDQLELIKAIGGNLDKRPPAYINGAPPHNQVQYITYTTPGSVTQLNGQNTGGQQHIQINNRNPATPFIELDFNPKNPFVVNQGNKGIQHNQVPRGVNSQSNNFGKVQPVINFDINFNTPYPPSQPPTGHVISQQLISRTPLPPSSLNTKKIQINTISSLSNLDFDPNNPFNKNYRDDKTHEPIFDADPFFDKEGIPYVERSENEKGPVSSHENPPEVPTRPIYPGEGKWAKFGVKHKPHITPHTTFVTLEESTDIPDGYDTFIEGQKLFDDYNNQFGRKLQEFPQRYQLENSIPNNQPNPYYEQVNTQNPEEEDQAEKDKVFVPERLYAQVRHSEDVKHLPPAADENGRLKELIKDSKVHTIYSEEGYEDLAYDHAGHEKKAENAEGYEKDKKEIVNEKEKIHHNIRIQPSETTTDPAKDEKLTEEDFQHLKEEALSLDDDDDSETEATEFDKSIISKVKPPKKVYSARTKDSSKYNVKDEDFMEGKDSSPVSTIVKGDGNTEIEISSEVKVIVQPNNTTKSHKYVKIYPKYRKNLGNEDNLNDNKVAKATTDKNLDATKTSSIETPVTTISPSIEEIFTVEIPATTQATTAIPKIKHWIHRRLKRETDYFPEIEVDTDFIDKINHTLPKVPTKEERIKAKYPYYYRFKKIGLDENSPLRYSEDLKKIPPKKDGGNLAFYNQADMRKECAEVNPIVDPVPDRIKEADEKTDEAEETTDVAEIAESPRLTELDDKIDCFKAKYFGENPLDNPLFEEKSVGPIEPIFKELESIVTQTPVNSDNERRLSGKTPYKNTKRDVRVKKNPAKPNIPHRNEYQSNQDYNNGRRSRNVIKTERRINEIDNNYITENPKSDAETVDVTNIIRKSQREVVTLPPATLITTPKYTIDLKPKHIYDQIELLQYLPGEEPKPAPEKSVTNKPNDLSNKKRKLNKPKPSNKKRKYLEKTTEKILDIKQKRRPNDNSKLFERYSLFDEDAEKPTPALKEISNLGQGLDILSERGTQTTFTYQVNGNNVNAHPANKRKIKKKVASNLDGLSSKTKAKGIYEKRRGRVLNNRRNSANIEGSTETNELLPSAEPLKRHRRLRKRSRFPFIFDINPYIPKIPVAKPPFVDIILTPRPSYLNLDISGTSDFEIFDTNKYSPTTSESIGEETNVIPKHVMSEVFYKDDIKPDEQLNVFTDVFNNIRNSPYYEDLYNAPSETVAVKMKPDMPLVKDSTNEDDWRSTTVVPTKYRNGYKNHQLPELTTNSKTRRTNNKIDVRQKGSTTIRPLLLHNIHKNHKTYASRTQLQADVAHMKPNFEINRTVKRNERIQTTTLKPTPESAVIEEDDDVDEDEDESTEVMGLVPPDTHGYKTIYNPKRDNSMDIATEEEVEKKKINKFIVPGMKPPPKRRVYNYSDYLTANHIRQKSGKPKRTKRNANRPAYAEVTRNRGIIESVEKNETKKEDDDDYVPNRSRNYHYDEKTGQIVYDKKPEVQDESEEVEYIEVIEETPPSTTSKPKQNPIFATATPPPVGQSYVDFVKLLKSASNYHEIPDPTTTEKGKESSTTETITTTTLKPVSTTPPEFLSILAKVRNDTSYKPIEDKKKIKTTTTSKPIEDASIEDAEDEESQVQPVQNSPGSIGIVNGQMLKIFDITDFLPKVKNYMPKTAIDTSRYKAIQRPTLRNNLSSRYNSEKDTDLHNINTSKTPLLNNDERREDVKESSIEKVISPNTSIKNFRRGPTTARSSPTSSTAKVNRGNRRRVTTVRSTTTTQGEATATPLELTRNRRMHRRRNPRLQLTTAATDKATTKAADAPKIIHRRSQRDSSTLSSENKEQILLENQANYRKTRTQGEAPTSVPGKRSLNENKNDTNTIQVAQKVADIFRNYNQIRKRNGNVKEEDEVIASENRVGQPHRNRIVSNNDDVAVFKKYDKSRKHGGNYRTENEDNAQLLEKQSEQDIDVFKDYDKTKKHGGNYRRENEGGEFKEPTVEKTDNDKTNDVETFKDYDKTKKNGDNYKSEDEVQHISEPQLEESRVLTPKGNQIESNVGKVKDTEVFNKGFDKSKKHGGNYISEDEAQQKASLQDKTKEIEIFNNYDKTKKHGGNYKPELEGTIDPEIDESAYDDHDSEQKLQKRNEEDPALIDVVFKPETFYRDPKLPAVINDLKIVDDLSHEDLEEIVASAEDGSFGDESESNDNERKDSQNVLESGEKNRILDQEIPPDVSTTTKKPLFIKDPSQRLYFYAPLR